MQIHEITKSRVDEALGTMVGDLIKGGIARAIGGGGTPAEKLAAGQSAQIASLANRALAQWQAKQTQLAQTLGTPNFDEELEAWVEDNLLPNRLNVEDLDPAYKNQIKAQIAIVNQIPDTDLPKKRAAFQKLVSTAVMSRPARQAVGQIRTRATNQSAIQAANALALAGIDPTSITAKNFSNVLRQQGVASVSAAEIQRYAGGNEALTAKILQAGGIAVQ